MNNQEFTQLFGRIADILQIKDENAFKIKAYRNAAISIAHLNEDLQSLYAQKKLDQIPGIGKAIKEKIEEVLETGTCQYYERLCQEVPSGLIDMLTIPGVGPKTVRLIYEKLGITNLETLQEAARQQQIRDIPGLGQKSEEKILKGLEMLRGMQEKHTLGTVLPIAQDLCNFLHVSPAVEQLSSVGSVRRGKALVGDLDILVASRDELEVRKRMQVYPQLRCIQQEEKGHIAGILAVQIPFEIIIVSPEEYAEALFWTTGSKEHRSLVLGNQMRSAIKAVRSEQELYQFFHMDYIAPELRENRGEIEAARKKRLPKLVELGDLQGDLHVHSNWSDGGSSIADMAAAARRLNYAYLAITDHSQSLVISRGLTLDRLKAQAAEIDQLNQSWKDFRILKGIEVDIRKDGSLDFPDEVLQDLDIVVASIHSHFHLSKEEQSERLLKAIKNEHVDVIGHLTGRLLNRRPAYELDIERILTEAAKNHIALEINAHPDRLDIDEMIARQARDMGVKLTINSDAHHESQLGLVHFGVKTARRGWLEKKDLLNTLDLDNLLSELKIVNICTVDE